MFTVNVILAVDNDVDCDGCGTETPVEEITVTEEGEELCSSCVAIRGIEEEEET